MFAVFAVFAVFVFWLLSPFLSFSHFRLGCFHAIFTNRNLNREVPVSLSLQYITVAIWRLASTHTHTLTLHVSYLLHLQSTIIIYLYNYTSYAYYSCMFMYLHFCAHINPSIRSCINTLMHRYKMRHRYKSACIGRKINTKTYFEHITVHSHATQYKRDQRSTVQYNTVQDRQCATPRYSTTQHIRTNTQYIMLISFPSLT